MEDDVDMARADEDVTDLDDMKKRLKEMEDEAAALREMQAKVEKEMGSVQDPVTAGAAQANREEVDSRSVFVGNVRPFFSCSVRGLYTSVVSLRAYAGNVCPLISIIQKK